MTFVTKAEDLRRAKAHAGVRQPTPEQRKKNRREAAQKAAQDYHNALLGLVKAAKKLSIAEAKLKHFER